MADFKTMTVWQRSHELALDVCHMAETLPVKHEALARGLIQAAILIPAKIANGCGRGRRNPSGFARMLRLSFTSARTLKARLRDARDAGVLSADGHDRLAGELDAVTRLLAGHICRAAPGRIYPGRVLRRRTLSGIPRTDN